MFFVKPATLPELRRPEGHVGAPCGFPKFGFIPRSGRRLIFGHLPLRWQRAYVFSYSSAESSSGGWQQSHLAEGTLGVRHVTAETDFPCALLFLVWEGPLPARGSFSQLPGQSTLLPPFPPADRQVEG